MQGFPWYHLVRVMELRQNSEARIQFILSRMKIVLFKVAAAAVFFHRTTKTSTKSSVLEAVTFADFSFVFSIS